MSSALDPTPVWESSVSEPSSLCPFMVALEPAASSELPQASNVMLTSAALNGRAKRDQVSGEFVPFIVLVFVVALERRVESFATSVTRKFPSD